MRQSGSGRAFLAGVRTILPVLLGVAPFGLLFGALVTRSGLPLVAAIALSLIVFAGASQFAFVQLAATGAPLPIVVLGSVVLNLRHLLYSASLAPHLARTPTLARWLSAYFLTDEAYALALRRADEGERDVVPFYWGAAVTLWSCWQLTTVLGAVVGAGLPESPLYAFTLPLTFVAIVVPAVRDRNGLAVAVAAALLGVALAGVPLGAGLLVSSALAIALGVALDRANA